MDQAGDEKSLGVHFFKGLGPKCVAEKRVPDSNKHSREVAGETESEHEHALGVHIGSHHEEEPTAALANRVDHIAGDMLEKSNSATILGDSIMNDLPAVQRTNGIGL